jgi:hypothetical protein
VILFFVSTPVLYMVLNALSCPDACNIDGMWDTRSYPESIVADEKRHAREEEDEDDDDSDDMDDDAYAYHSGYTLPAICDEDVGTVNDRVRLRLSAISKRDR